MTARADFVPGRIFVVLLAGLLTTLTLQGQGPTTNPVTTAVVEVGIPGAISCQDGNTITALTNGVLARATLTYTFDRDSGLLDLVVENNSPIVPGEENPMITEINFNIPTGAVLSVNLVGQTASPMGAIPTFFLVTDLNILDGSNSLGVGCMGDFSCRLDRSASGINGSIRNAAATEVAGNINNMVTGPVTFTFQISGNLETLTAGSFASAFSQDGAAPANASLKFQAGGPGGEESGFLGNKPDCEPNSWFIGEPRIGSTVTLVQSGAPGCSGCVVYSFSPGPITISGVQVPVGLPAFELVSAIQPSNTVATFQIPIPNDVNLVGVTIYFAVVLVDPSFTVVESSPGFSQTLLPAI
jgi:hypothetical protein